MFAQYESVSYLCSAQEGICSEMRRPLRTKLQITAYWAKKSQVKTMGNYKQMAKEINGWFAEGDGESVATALDDRVEIYLVPKTAVFDRVCVDSYVHLCCLQKQTRESEDGMRITIY